MPQPPAVARCRSASPGSAVERSRLWLDREQRARRTADGLRHAQMVERTIHCYMGCSATRARICISANSKRSIVSASLSVSNVPRSISPAIAVSKLRHRFQPKSQVFIDEYSLQYSPVKFSSTSFYPVSPAKTLLHNRLDRKPSLIFPTVQYQYSNGVKTMRSYFRRVVVNPYMSRYANVQSCNRGVHSMSPCAFARTQRVEIFNFHRRFI